MSLSRAGPPRLGDLLVQNRLITPAQLEAALAHQEATGLRLGEGLVSLGFVSESRLHGFLARLRRKVRIGDRLVEAGRISREQLDEALAEQGQNGGKLGQVLVERGWLSERAFLGFLARELFLPFVDLQNHSLDHETVAILKESAARRFQAIVLSHGGDGILVGMADPTDLFAFDELTRLLGRSPRLALVSESLLPRALDLAYRGENGIQRHAAALDEEVARADFDLDGLVRLETAVDAPVVRILQSLFEDAVRMNASDIHIEPDDEVLRIRQRIDGLLHEQVVRERRIAPALVSKLKLMAGLEIAEKRLPQDGRFNMTVRDHSIDVRLSTLPIQNGESVVMRLLDQSGGHLHLEKLGMDPALLARFNRLIRQPHGLVLVTGPTGSGKTTTLYGALNALNDPAKKIITVEDPVEYRLPRVNQVQVKPRINLTFARVLRTVLRQDPDIILVGEMRDRETAEIAIRAALTGHLVFSTLHTTSAVTATVRMVEMGLEGYAVAAALGGILAQRLVRRVCVDCLERGPPDPGERLLLEGVLGVGAGSVRLARGRGCARCHQTGCQGRIAVMELLEMHGELADALRREDLSAFVRAAARQEGYLPLHRVALDLAVRGVIPLAEALGLAADVDADGVDR